VISSVAAVASFIAGYTGTAISMIAISGVFDILYVLAIRDRRTSGDASPKR